MKAIITIFQCKRVVLPYIFLKHCLPKMQEIFPGEMKAYLIQHTGGFFGKKTFLETSHIDDSRLDLVRQWTEEGKYENATVIQHQECLPHYPHMPSMRIGVEKAIEEEADFHLWMDDDCFIMDTECDRWPELIGQKDIGVYNHKADIVNVAYFVSTLKFDKHMLPIMSDKKNWSIVKDNKDKNGVFNPRRIESRLAMECKTDRGLLREDCKARVHRNRVAGIDSVWEKVKALAPDKLKLLNIDFSCYKKDNKEEEVSFDSSLISISTTVMNRTEYLLKAIPTWINRGFKEIIVVDWSSESPVAPFLEKFKGFGIRVVRVEGQDTFLPTKARNIGAFMCQSPYVWLLDSDIKLVYDDSIRDSIKLKPGALYQGHHAKTGKSTTGSCIVYKEDFEKVNGYSELIATLAGEDFDLYERMAEIGVLCNIFNLGVIEHIDHPKSLRTKYRPWYGMTQYQGRLYNKKLDKWGVDYQRDHIPTNIIEIG